MSEIFGQLRSAIHSGGALPVGWMESERTHCYALDHLHGREWSARGDGEPWRHTSITVTAGHTAVHALTGDELERALQYVVAVVVEEANREHNPDADPRTIAAIQARYQWARGEITREVRDAAMAAAWDASRAAAWDAARAAAWAAAWDAAWAASWAKAWTKAWAKAVTPAERSRLQRDEFVASNTRALTLIALAYREHIMAGAELPWLKETR